MPTHPAYKVVPIWRREMLKLAKQGHNIKAVCHTLKVGYDRLVVEKRRDPDFAAELDAAIEAGKSKPIRRIF